MAVSTAASFSSGPAVSAFDDDGPPMDVLAADESAMRGELASRGESVAASAAARAQAAPDAEDEAAPPSLPPLDQMIERIPAQVREVLDELFRARFVKVVRVPKKALKSSGETRASA